METFKFQQEIHPRYWFENKREQIERENTREKKSSFDFEKGNPFENRKKGTNWALWILGFIFLLNLGFLSHLTLDFLKIFFLTNLWYFWVLANCVCLCLILQVVSYVCLNLRVLEFSYRLLFHLFLLLCSSIRLKNNWLRSNDSKVH